jgi:hypothetical protein
MITVYLEDLISVIAIIGFMILVLLILTGRKMKLWWI